MRAKKSFGQHFLTNEDIDRRIVEFGLQNEPVRVLEVGPGKGVLTKYLIEKDLDLIVVEADNDMVAYLNEHYPALKNRIIAQDFLKIDFQNLFPPPPGDYAPPPAQFTIIGNFPYNISSQIVFKMVENRDRTPALVGMFQREMAERIIAKPGGKDYGVISVLTQAFYEGKLLMRVGNRNFNPPPKVESAVIQLLRKNETLGCDEALFRQVVKQVFNQRRKMLRNTMKPFFPNAGILEDPFFTKRPEVLSVEDFVSLTNLAGRYQPAI
jgi:16S rRNA (adenine1518-N6/adenine1519-N6)-dimethyltransferase